jgi:hypothetical protein
MLAHDSVVLAYHHLVGHGAGVLLGQGLQGRTGS